MGANKTIHSASEVAKALISLSDPDMGDIMTNLKLQKLLYYTQGYHLALYNQPIFEEEIEAWQYGPVVPSVYHEYKTYGATGIITEEKFDSSSFDSDQLDLLAEIYEIFGQYSALKLMEMTHQETPWRSTDLSHVITKDALYKYFIAFVNTNNGQEEQN